VNMVACGVRVEACKICGHSRHIGHLSPRSYSVSGALFTITSVAAPGSAQLCVPLGPGNRDTGPRTLRAQPSVVLDVPVTYHPSIPGKPKCLEKPKCLDPKKVRAKLPESNSFWVVL
jgi:hypothetical protein